MLSSVSRCLDTPVKHSHSFLIYYILQSPGFGSLLPLHAKYFCSWDMLLLQTSQDSLRCHGMPYAFQYVIFDVKEHLYNSVAQHAITLRLDLCGTSLLALIGSFIRSSTPNCSLTSSSPCTALARRLHSSLQMPSRCMSFTVLNHTRHCSA